MKKHCPVCEIELSEPLPSFCAQCAWDLKNDITLNISIDLPAGAVEEYKKWVSIARKNWQEKQRLLKEKLNHDTYPHGQMNKDAVPVKSNADKELLQLEIEKNRLALEMKKAEIEAANLKLAVEREITKRALSVENEKKYAQMDIDRNKIREEEKMRKRDEYKRQTGHEPPLSWY